MPIEIKSEDEIEGLLEKAEEIRVVRNGDSSKLKLRTADRLYTFKTTEDKIDSLIKGTKTPIVEL